MKRTKKAKRKIVKPVPVEVVVRVVHEYPKERPLGYSVGRSDEPEMVWSSFWNEFVPK